MLLTESEVDPLESHETGSSQMVLVNCVLGFDGHFSVPPLYIITSLGETVIRVSSSPQAPTTAGIIDDFTTHS